MALEKSWFDQMGGEFSKPYMQELKRFLIGEREAGKFVFPRASLWFRAFELTPFESVKTVILGQDPYHGAGQAHGLAFSVQKGVTIPPSLANVYIELKNDINFTPPDHGFLEKWALEGVLLLNATLSVEKDRAGSHQNRGWEIFTDRAIEALSNRREHLVFMLWGSYAQKKAGLIDIGKHLILKAPHPSPLSAHRGFFGCGHFSKANEYLKRHGITPIEWQL
ncbi:MAG: uracil-DNA glycosylase [Helicobacteraceae bacterium]|jgi:uracil-DNA glycosylase|nr:uracil-DNA glycosylase [Helicobacteraceae bacterium]